MKLPAQSKPLPERTAKAPYNFVPLPEQVVTVNVKELPAQDCYHAGRFTGWLDCELTTASPLYVRAALNMDEFKRSLEKEEEKRPWREQVRNKPDFFYTGQEAGQGPPRPVIPGSSLRGLLRAMVEIAGYGKVQWVTDRNLVYRVVGDTTSHGEKYRARLMRFDGEGTADGKRYHMYTPLMQAGYMEQASNGDWYIRPAKEINGTTFARISDKKIPNGLKPWASSKNAQELWVEVGPYDYQLVRGGFIRNRYAKVRRAAAGPAAGLQRAALARSGWIASKRSEAVVFEPDPNARRIPVSDDLVRRYQDQVSSIYNQQARRDGKKSLLLDDKGVLVDQQPVFYLMEEGRLVFFGHCMMFRLPYHKSPRDFVPAELRRETEVDLAEALFGYTKRQGEGKNRAYAGRVFVSDASTGQADPWLDEGQVVTPKILGTPKPTTFQHYLVQRAPNPVLIGGRFKDGSPRTQVHLDDYASATPAETVLRGHKLYWHKGLARLEEIQEAGSLADNDTQHTQMRPVKEGVTFKFRIRFENLSGVEMGALLWVLDKAGDEAYRLKLGMGKPYGLGAVAVSGKLHLEDRHQRYSRLFGEDTWASTGQDGQAGWMAAVAAFERFVLDGLGEGARRLDDLDRVQSLLALLAWPGPNPAETRYLEIEHPDPSVKRGKINEYKERPVVPLPQEVLGKARPPRPKPAEVVIPPGYQQGTVQKFGLGPKQSFGFIASRAGGPQVFVHKSALAEGVETLREGDVVVFRVEQGMKGPEARDVRPVA